MNSRKKAQLRLFKGRFNALPFLHVYYILCLFRGIRLLETRNNAFRKGVITFSKLDFLKVLVPDLKDIFSLMVGKYSGEKICWDIENLNEVQCYYFSNKTNSPLIFFSALRRIGNNSSI